MNKTTALRNTCQLTTPSPIVNEAFRIAKDHVARCMRWYSLGWGMSNSPHSCTIVVGRDTGWMTIGADYVAPWFAPEALKVFRDRQQANGKILEYVDMESGESTDYGLNVSDNTPYYLWALCHHWQVHSDERFLDAFSHSAILAADFLISCVHENGLIRSVPAGTAVSGITGWRNIIDGYVLAGEVTELNSLSAMALRMAGEVLNDARYVRAGNAIAEAINERLWVGDRYLLTRFNGAEDSQLTGDAVFPILCGIAPPDRARLVLDRLWAPDFWNESGMRTLPSSDAKYEPRKNFGALGGVWPNLTLWYAAAAAPYYPDRALKAIELVAKTVAESLDEFPEYFDGDTGVPLGMALSPWVAPTFIWAVLEGLLGLRWRDGQISFSPNWPALWDTCTLTNLPTARQSLSQVISRS